MTKKEKAQELANEIITHPYTNNDIDNILKYVYSIKYKDGSDITEADIDFITNEIINVLYKYVEDSSRKSDRPYFSSENILSVKALADYLKDEINKTVVKK